MAKTMCCAPSSRRAPSHAAKASEVMERPRLSRRTTTGVVRAWRRVSQSSIASWLRNASALQRANAEHRSRYTCVRESKPPFDLAEEPRRGPMWASVRSMGRRIPQTGAIGGHSETRVDEPRRQARQAAFCLRESRLEDRCKGSVPLVPLFASGQHQTRASGYGADQCDSPYSRKDRRICN